jgi:hypothetical protein
VYLAHGPWAGACIAAPGGLSAERTAIVATTTEQLKQIEFGALVEKLKEIAHELDVAHELVEEFEMQYKGGPTVFNTEERWLLNGFTEEALLELKTMTGEILSVRADLLGGTTSAEAELLHAVGG